MNRIMLADGSCELAYRDIGDGIPLLLLHGFCGSSGYWDGLVPLLSPRFRLLIPDLPGHGQSSVPAHPYTMEAYADSMHVLLRRLDIDEAVWIGHSLGGYITLAAVERHAVDVMAFGLVHSTAYPDDAKGKENRLNAIHTIREQGIDPFVDALIPKLFAPNHLDTMSEHVERAKAIGRSTSPDGAIQALLAMKDRPDRNHVLRTTNIPAILVSGAKDQIIAPEKTFSVPNDRQNRVLLDSAGHMSMFEAPDLLAQALLRFLKR